MILVIVGIDDDFVVGEIGIVLRFVDDEFVCWVDEIFGFCVQEFCGEYFFDDVFDEIFFDFCVFYVGSVLCGDYDVYDFGGYVVDVVDGDLGFCVGVELFYFVVFVDFGEFVIEVVGENDGSGYEFFGFVGSKIEYQILVVGVLFGVFFIFGLFGIDVLCDVGGLGGEVVINKYGVGVENVVVVYIVDVVDCIVDDFVDVDCFVEWFGFVGFFVLQFWQGDFVVDDDDVGFYEGFVGDVGCFVECQVGVEYVVGD